MPNFAISFLYRNETLKNHKVISFLTEPTLVTGGEGGELVVWDNKLEPQCVMFPNFSDAPGSVILMAALKCPFLSILDKLDQLLLTVHQDQRVRLWDIRDGRCIQVSSHNVFHHQNVRNLVILRPTNCRFVVFNANSPNVMLFDIWRMKVIKQYSLGEGINTGTAPIFRGIWLSGDHTLRALDNTGTVHLIQGFEDDSLNDYFIQRSSAINDEYKVVLKEQYCNVPNRPLIKAFYENELKVSVLIFTNQLSLLMDNSIQLVIQQSNNNEKFIDAQFIMNENERLLFITCRSGSVIPLKWNDIQILIQHLKTNKDFVISYKEFQFQNMPNSSTGVVQLNMRNILNNIKQNIDKKLRRYAQSVCINRSSMNSRIFYFDRLKGKLISYDTNELINQIDDRLSLFTKEKQDGINLDGFSVYLNFKSFLVEQSKFLYKNPKPLNSLELATTCPTDLYQTLETLFQHDFMKTMWTYLIDVVKPGDVTSRCLYSGDPTSPLYLFGCNTGVVYGFPLTWQPKQGQYSIISVKVDQGRGCSVVFIQVKGQLLFCSSEKGRVSIFNLHDYILNSGSEAQNRLKKYQSMTFSQSDKKNQIIQEEKRKLNIISPPKLSDSILPDKLIQTLKIKHIQLELSNEDLEDTILQTIDQESQSNPAGLVEKSDFVAFQLQNNGAVVYSLESGNSVCNLNGIQENCKIYGIYLETRSMHWLICTSEGALYVYDLTGRFQRLLHVQTHHWLFRAEERLQRLQAQTCEYHRLSEYSTFYSKDISQVHVLLEYALRSSFIAGSAIPMSYETIGPLKQIQFQGNEAHRLMWLLDFAPQENQCKYSKQKLTRVIQRAQTGDVEWWDLRNVLPEKENDLRHQLCCTLFPWGADAVLDAQLDSLCNGNRPVFSINLGIHSAGDSFSFSFRPRWSTSQYLTNLQAMVIMHYYIGLQYKDNSLMTSLMFQTVELFTKKRLSIDANFQSLEIIQLARYTIDESNEIMTAACNLIISQVINKDSSMDESLIRIRKLLEIQFNEPNTSGLFSICEVICLVVKSYADIFSENKDIFKPAAERVIAGVDLKTAVMNPQLAAVLLKQVIDGLQYFKAYVNPPQLLTKLFIIFFNYNTVIEYLPTLRDNPQLGKKHQQVTFEELNKQSEETKQRMKQLAVKAIIHVGNLSLQDFYALIRKDILNMEFHMLYPCSIIDLIRNYIKSSQQNATKHLPFLIEIILKSLDPNNPNLRKVCHKAATKALQTVCKMFNCVSFHQATQKIALGSSDNQIIIYDLRTAVKWRVLDGHDGQVTSLGFDNEGKHLVSFSYVDSTLRIWKVGSTGFFGSILGIQGKATSIHRIQRKQIDANTKVVITFSENDTHVLLKIGEQTPQSYKI